MLTHRNGKISTPHCVTQIHGPVLDPGRIGTEGDGSLGMGCDQPGKKRTLVSTSTIHEAVSTNQENGVETVTKVRASQSGIKALEQVDHEFVVSSSEHDLRAVLDIAPRLLIMVS